MVGKSKQRSPSNQPLTDNHRNGNCSLPAGVARALEHRARGGQLPRQVLSRRAAGGGRRRRALLARLGRRPHARAAGAEAVWPGARAALCAPRSPLGAPAPPRLDLRLKLGPAACPCNSRLLRGFSEGRRVGGWALGRAFTFKSAHVSAVRGSTRHTSRRERARSRPDRGLIGDLDRLALPQTHARSASAAPCRRRPPPNHPCAAEPEPEPRHRHPSRATRSPPARRHGRPPSP